MMEINGESTSMMWPILGSRTAKEQNRTGLASVEMSAHTSFAHAGENDSDKRAKTRLPMTSQSSTAEQSAFHTDSGLWNAERRAAAATAGHAQSEAAGQGAPAD